MLLRPLVLVAACLPLPLPALAAHSVWTDVPPPAAAPLNVVRFYNRISGWAAGSGGTLERFDRGTWQNAPSGTDEDLFGLAVLGSGVAWAVGDHGTILRFDGSRWIPHAQSKAVTLLPLHAVAFLNPDNGWAVGGDANNPGLGGIILHYNGSSWVSATTTSDPLYDLALLSSDFVWFCGGNRRIIRFDGNVFTNRISPILDGRAWRAVEFPFRSIGWFAGEQASLVTYEASSDGFLNYGAVGTLTTQALNDISFLAGDFKGYVVGDQGVRVYMENLNATVEATGGGDLHAVQLINDLEGAAVGGSGTGRILMQRVVTGETTLKQVRVWPNPFDPSSGQRVTLDRLPNDVSRLEVFTLGGERLAALGDGVTYDADTGVARWEGHRRDGRAVASGTYPYRVGTKSGLAARGLILVARR